MPRTPKSSATTVHILVALAALIVTRPATAQRDNRGPIRAGFSTTDCHGGCVIDSVALEMERARRNQPPALSASFVLVDTVASPRRGPALPRERSVPIWIACDSAACGAAVLTGKVSERRVDDGRVARRTVAVWPVPVALAAKASRAAALTFHADGRAHVLPTATVVSAKPLFDAMRAGQPTASYSPRMQLYIATFAGFGVPGDSTMAEDVGTATEPLMMPDAATPPPTRVATLTLVGRGADAVAVLVQDDAAGAAPIFGVGEAISVAMPGRAGVGRRATVGVKALARQRVEVLRDTCDSEKVWTYLIALPAAEMAALRRGAQPSPRPGDLIDRWSGTAVRESYPARMSAAESRGLSASRAVVAQFVREHAASGVRDRDVQVLAQLPRNAGYVTNFGVFSRDQGGGWRFPTLTLRKPACE